MAELTLKESGRTAGGKTAPLEGVGGAARVHPDLLYGEDEVHGVFKVENQFNYVVAPAATTTVLQVSAGAVGDLLHAVAISANTGTLTIKDGGTSVLVIPAGALGCWELNLVSKVGAWSIVAAAASSCTAIGRFS